MLLQRLLEAVRRAMPMLKPRLTWQVKPEVVQVKVTATISREDLMTTFNEREKSFEKKFAHDQDLKFKAESRRNRMIAEWAAVRLGLSGAVLDDYIKAVRRADLAEKGDDDVVRKISKDLADKGVQASEQEIRQQMGEFLAKAVADIEAGR